MFDGINLAGVGIDRENWADITPDVTELREQTKAHEVVAEEDVYLYRKPPDR